MLGRLTVADHFDFDGVLRDLLYLLFVEPSIDLRARVFQGPEPLCCFRSIAVLELLDVFKTAPFALHEEGEQLLWALFIEHVDLLPVEILRRTCRFEDVHFGLLDVLYVHDRA